MADQLKFGISADVNPALQAMTAVEQRSVVLQKRIESLQNVIGQTNSIQKLNQAMTLLGKSQSELSRISSQAGGSLSSRLAPGSNEATQSLINLSRVAQDAPFGFLGIANNINPLIESFQRLKGSTGTTGGAIKALGAALTGPAGLGLAVGVASSLLITFGDKLFNTGKASKEAEDGIKKLAEGVASELVTLTSLVGLAGNVNASYENRSKAIKALNDQYGKYLPGLNEEKINVNNLAEAYDKITESLLNQAVIKGSQAAIEKIVAETAQKILRLKQQEADAVRESNEQYQKEQKNRFVQPTAQQALDKYVKSKENENGVVRDGNLALQEQIKNNNVAIKSTNIYDVLINKLTADLKNQLKPLLSLTTQFSDLDETLKNVSDTTKEFDEIAGLQFVLKGFEKVLLAAKAVNALDVENLRIAISGVAFEPKPSFYQQLQRETSNAIQKARPQAFEAPQVKLPYELTPEQINFYKTLNSVTEDVNKTIANLQMEGFASIGEAIGAMLSGGDIKGVFQNFANLISGGVIAIGKQMIALGLMAEKLKIAIKTLFANPIALVAAGIGLVAVGAAIRGALSKGIEAREKGGPVSGNTPYLVGERGPELFVPSVGGSIIPNNQLSGFNGRPAFAAAMGGGRSIVRGTDILLASARTQRSIARVNG